MFLLHTGLTCLTKHKRHTNSTCPFKINRSFRTCLLPSVFPSIRVFSSESALHIRWAKYWSLSFSISSSNEYSGLISFRMDWFDLHAAQGALKSLLQYHGSKASVLQCSAFFIVQLSHPYMTTGKTHSFNYTELCQQSNVYFLILYLVLS